MISTRSSLLPWLSGRAAALLNVYCTWEISGTLCWYQRHQSNLYHQGWQRMTPHKLVLRAVKKQMVASKWGQLYTFMKILDDWAIRTKSSLQTPPEDFHYKVFKCVEINYICKNLGVKGRECVCCSVYYLMVIPARICKYTLFPILAGFDWTLTSAWDRIGTCSRGRFTRGKYVHMYICICDGYKRSVYIWTSFSVF